MDDQQAGNGDRTDVRHGRVVAELEASRRMTRDGRSEGEIALDGAAEKLLNAITADNAIDADESGRIDQSGASAVAPVVVRSLGSGPGSAE